MNAERVLVVGGEAGTEHHLANLLQRWGYTPVLVPSLEEAIAAVAYTRFLFTVVDGELACVDGAEPFRRLRNGGGNSGPIVLLADPNIIAQDRELPALGADASLGGSPEPPGPSQASLKDIAREAARAAERVAIAKALEDTGWNRVRAARLLKISYRALLYKIKEAGLKQGPIASTHPPDLGAGREDLHPPPAA